MSTAIVKLFWSGRSQAVRLPKAFRFDGTQVRIRQHGSAVIIEPIPDNWTWLDELNPPDQDFIAEAATQPEAQQRDELDTLFK